MVKKSTVAGGRIAIYIPDHPKANNRGYILHSRYVMEQHLEHLLESGEEVHHINGDETDDRIENLQVLSKSEHAKLHGGRPRKLNYDWIAELRGQGLGCKRIAKQTGYLVKSVRSAVLVMERA